MSIDYLAWPAKEEDLIQILLYAGDQPVSSHMHSFIEIVFVAHGSCVHKYHGTEVTLIPGDIFIVVPHEEHSYTITSRTVIYNCLFYPEALGEDWKSLRQIKGLYDLLMVEPFYRSEEKKQEILHLQPAEASNLESILKLMLKEQTNRQTGAHLVIKANLIMLLASLGRAWENQFPGDMHSYGGKREMLTEALKHIEENMNKDLTISDLAARVYLSPHYFRKVFREVTGLTPIEYINKIRISKAAQLLVQKDHSISEIAEKVGIMDMNYFSRMFRTHMGCSPTDYRRRNNTY